MWNRANLEYIVRSYNDGAPLAEMAKELNENEKEVRNKIAQIIDSPTLVKLHKIVPYPKHPREKNAPWCLMEYDHIRRCFPSKCTVRKIAKTLRRTAESVGEMTTLLTGKLPAEELRKYLGKLVAQGDDFKMIAFALQMDIKTVKDMISEDGDLADVYGADEKGFCRESEDWSVLEDAHVFSVHDSITGEQVAANLRRSVASVIERRDKVMDMLLNDRRACRGENMPLNAKGQETSSAVAAEVDVTVQVEGEERSGKVQYYSENDM